MNYEYLIQNFTHFEVSKREGAIIIKRGNIFAGNKYKLFYINTMPEVSQLNTIDYYFFSQCIQSLLILCTFIMYTY